MSLSQIGYEALHRSYLGLSNHAFWTNLATEIIDANPIAKNKVHLRRHADRNHQLDLAPLLKAASLFPGSREPEKLAEVHHEKEDLLPSKLSQQLLLFLSSSNAVRESR